MRFLLTNRHAGSLDVVVEPGATLERLSADSSLAVEWSGGGPAGLVCRPGRITLVTPDGGHVRLRRADGSVVEAGLWPDGLAAYPASPRMRLRVANGTGWPLRTAWEPTGLTHEMPAQSPPLRAEWLGVEADDATEVVYGAGWLTLCDGIRSMFRGWRPGGGAEIETLAWMIGGSSELAGFSEMPWPARPADAPDDDEHTTGERRRTIGVG